MPRAFVILARVVAVAYILAGAVGGLWPDFWDDSSAGDQILWIVLLVGGGLLILAGLQVFTRSPWGGAALVSIGAVVGALPVFWTIIALLAALVLVVWSIVAARRMGGASPVPD